MHSGNKLFFYIIKMETLYFHAKQNLLFLKCLICLSLKYSSECMSDSAISGPLALRFLTPMAVDGFSEALVVSVQEVMEVSTSLRHLQKASFRFTLILDIEQREESWQL